MTIRYACAHAWMHRSENYWIHKFHHSFSEQTFIRPISANTVTTTEFLIAYVSVLFQKIDTHFPELSSVHGI